MSATQASAPTKSAPLRTLQPRTDLFEAEGAHLLLMDLPGVDTEALSVQVEERVLTVEATTSLPEVEGSLRSAAFQPVRYRRTMVLGEQVDAEHIRAELRGGILTVTLPHAAPAQARRIAIQTV